MKASHWLVFSLFRRDTRTKNRTTHRTNRTKVSKNILFVDVITMLTTLRRASWALPCLVDLDIFSGSSYDAARWSWLQWRSAPHRCVPEGPPLIRCTEVLNKSSEPAAAKVKRTDWHRQNNRDCHEMQYTLHTSWTHSLHSPRCGPRETERWWWLGTGRDHAVSKRFAYVFCGRAELSESWTHVSKLPFCIAPHTGVYAVI